MSNPLVSIVMTNYNGEKFIRMALKSVMLQTFEDWELLVVNDASTDGSLAVVQEFDDPRIRILDLPVNQQVSYAHNIANRECRGKYIATIDNDDMWLPHKLEKQVRYMEAHPEVGVCFTSMQLIDENDKLIDDQFKTLIFQAENRTREEWLHELLVNGNHLLNDSSLIRTEVMRAIGENDLCMLQLHDYDMWIRIPQIAEMHIIQEPLVLYRTFVGSGSISQPSRRNDNRSYFEYSYLIGNTVTNMEDGLFLRVFAKELVRREAQSHTEVLCEKALLMSGDTLCTNVRLYAFNLLHDLFASEEGRQVLRDQYGFTQHQVYALTGDPIFYDDQMRMKTAEMEYRIRELEKELESAKAASARPALVQFAARGAAKVRRMLKAGTGLHGKSVKPSLPGGPLSEASIQTSSSKEAGSRENETVSILVPFLYDDSAALMETVQSVLGQDDGAWELILALMDCEEEEDLEESCRGLPADPRIRTIRAGSLSECLKSASGEYVTLAEPGSRLEPYALGEIMQTVHAQGADFVFTDEGVLTDDGRDLSAIITKPEYACDTLRSGNSVGRLAVFSRSLLDRAGDIGRGAGEGAYHGLLLRLTDEAKCIRHIRRPLYSRKPFGTELQENQKEERSAVQAFLREKKGLITAVGPAPLYPSMNYIYYAMEKKPRVEVIMDVTEAERLDAMKEALSSLTLYRNFTVRFVTGKPVSWKQGRYDGGFASLFESKNPTRAGRLHEAAQMSTADVLLFLDEGLRPLQMGWMREMLVLTVQEHIGAVGGKICFADGTIRQAGLALGRGGRGLIERTGLGLLRASSGEQGFLASVRDVSAVSCECMMIEREKYLRAGGFSGDYRDALFDADLCLRLGKTGLNHVWTPFAELEGGDHALFTPDYGAEQGSYEADAETFRGKWKDALLQGDPLV